MKAVLITIVFGLAGGMTLGQTLCDPQDIPMQQPAKVKQVRGTIVDANGGVIPDVRVEILQQTSGESHKVKSLQTNRFGEVESKGLAIGAYRLEVTGPKGFCHIVVPIEVSATGWKGFRLVLPVGATDTCPKYCQTRYRLDKAEE